MSNSELNRILQSAPAPERPANYWEQFPQRVIAEAQRRQRSGALASSMAAVRVETPLKELIVSLLAGRRWFVSAAAAACVVLAFWLGFRQGQRSPALDPQWVEARKCFREIESLFPKQVEGLAFDASGAHLTLADEPDVPPSPPLYIKVMGPKGEHRFITFSGQHIRINGDTFEVLSDRQGDVLLVGQQSVWSSSDPGQNAGPYRIEARPLLNNS